MFDHLHIDGQEKVKMHVYLCQKQDIGKSLAPEETDELQGAHTSTSRVFMHMSHWDASQH